jgi:hypothetical protein
MVCLCFVCISEQTAIISLCNTNWLIFITEAECVYCAVRAGYLNIIQGCSYSNMCYVHPSVLERLLRASLVPANRQALTPSVKMRYVMF